MEDGEGDALCNDELVPRQTERCKDTARIIFGPTLHGQQVESIYTIFYEERDLLLLAKTALGRILSFNYFPFMCYPTGVIILMPLKLLHTRGHSTDG